MTAMAEKSIRFEDGDAYERGMSPWSQLAGQTFLEWLAPPAGLRWLDVGWSGRIVARFAVGEGFPVPLFRLRGGVTASPWRTFPRSPLKFRTASFPRYGFKAGLSDRAFPDPPSVKLAPSMPVA